MTSVIPLRWEKTSFPKYVEYRIFKAREGGNPRFRGRTVEEWILDELMNYCNQDEEYRQRLDMLAFRHYSDFEGFIPKQGDYVCPSPQFMLKDIPRVPRVVVPQAVAKVLITTEKKTTWCSYDGNGPAVLGYVQKAPEETVLCQLLSVVRKENNDVLSLWLLEKMDKDGLVEFERKFNLYFARELTGIKLRWVDRMTSDVLYSGSGPVTWQFRECWKLMTTKINLFSDNVLVFKCVPNCSCDCQMEAVFFQQTDARRGMDPEPLRKKLMFVEKLAGKMKCSRVHSAICRRQLLHYFDISFPVGPCEHQDCNCSFLLLEKGTKEIVLSSCSVDTHASSVRKMEDMMTLQAPGSDRLELFPTLQSRSLGFSKCVTMGIDYQFSLLNCIPGRAKVMICQTDVNSCLRHGQIFQCVLESGEQYCFNFPASVDWRKIKSSFFLISANTETEKMIHGIGILSSILKKGNFLTIFVECFVGNRDRYFYGPLRGFPRKAKSVKALRRCKMVDLRMTPDIYNVFKHCVDFGRKKTFLFFLIRKNIPFILDVQHGNLVYEGCSDKTIGISGTVTGETLIDAVYCMMLILEGVVNESHLSEGCREEALKVCLAKVRVAGFETIISACREAGVRCSVLSESEVAVSYGDDSLVSKNDIPGLVPIGTESDRDNDIPGLIPVEIESDMDKLD